MASSHRKKDVEVAIIGMACRTAGANSPSQLWDLLISSRDVRKEMTRFNAVGFYHPDGAFRKALTNVKHAYMMPDDLIDRFDHAFFHVPKVEAISIDPQQRHLLEVAYEAIESAGLPLEHITGTDTAVFAASDSSDYHTVIARDIAATPRYLATGTGACMAANRISYAFNLSGASMTVDTACSSSMTALDLAVKTLQRGDSAMAIVAGAKMIITPDMFMPSSELGFLGASGRCRSFDADGDGYGRGEGVLALILKPLANAVRDNDPIRSVIRGVRLNQDGRTQGITMPSAEAQRQNAAKLYSEIGVNPDDIQYVEAHGTGTPVGDPLEFKALRAVFTPQNRRYPLVVGSVKSNVGHLESAAGLASIIKVTLCLERQQIPPQMHFERPNPSIDFSGVLVPTKLTQWPHSGGTTARAAINTFGAGGTNGHAVLEAHYQASDRTILTGRPYLFMISAATDGSIHTTRQEYAELITRDRPRVEDLSYTLVARRSMLRQSYVFIARTLDDVMDRLRAENIQIKTKKTKNDDKVCMIFTGQGAQWPQMGKALLEQSPLFRDIIQKCDKALSELPDPPSWSIANELCKAADYSNVYQAAYAQPLCTALQLGLVSLWQSWGISPYAVVGHSSGEIAAAFAAGHLSLNNAIIISYYRGLCFTNTGSMKRGGMCAVGLNEVLAQSMIQDFAGTLQLAAVNSPSSCTLSGDQDSILQIVSRCKTEGIFAQVLHVDIAYHSNHVIPFAKHYQLQLDKAGVQTHEPKRECVMYSSVTGKPFERCTNAYWKDNMVSTVRFRDALVSCMEANPDVNTFLEIGAHPALKSAVFATLQGLGQATFDYYSSCERFKDDYETQLDSAASMMVQGSAVDRERINACEIMEEGVCSYQAGRVLTGLPSYAFDHSEPLWAESRMSKNLRFRKFPHHELLGSRYLEDTPLNPSWRNLLSLKSVPWLANRYAQYGETADMPLTGFVLVVLEAARQLQRTAHPESEQIVVESLLLDETLLLRSLGGSDHAVELHMTTRKIRETYHFDVMSLHVPQDTTLHHCQGSFRFASEPSERANVLSIVEPHDPFILEKARDIGRLPDSLRISTITSTSASASWTSTRTVTDYCIDPSVLEAALELACLPSLGSSPPRVTKIKSIHSLRFSVSPSESGVNEANMIVSYRNRDQADLHITTGRDAKPVLDIRVGLEQHPKMSDLPRVPPLRSLFYREITVPDITLIKSVDGLSVEQTIDMITHKWPACDVGIVGLDQSATQGLTNHLCSTPRRRYRSVQIVGQPNGRSNHHVHYTERFADGTKFHALFVQDLTTALSSGSHVLPGGIVLIQGNDAVDVSDSCLENGGTKLSRLGNVHDSLVGSWEVWRKARGRATGGPPRQSAACVFASDSRVASAIASLLSPTELVTLSPQAISSFCASPKQVQYDAIVLDLSESPVICELPGEVVVPWLRNLLTHANSILWVNSDAERNPFAGVAAALLRTMQCERPSLAVQSLVIGTDQDETSILLAIQDAQSGLCDSRPEIQHRYMEGTLCIGRWLPDDELSAAVGVALPLREPVNCTTPAPAEQSLDSTDDHQPQSAAELSTADKRKQPLFSPSNIYVVIGRLGGLGRHVCSWMASQGAKRLVVISRSGPHSESALAMQKLLTSQQVELEVLKADARDHTALSSALAHVRKRGAIKGVVNMAMLLGDAPLATMTGPQWDTALRLKVDSAWALHRATTARDDDLDFFILFSSIASVLGNRNQAGYNVGNAFLNALAAHRRARGLPALAIALGAMLDIGVLHELGGGGLHRDLEGTLARSGLSRLRAHHLDKIMEVATVHRTCPPVILTGLDMFERVDGGLVAERDQTMLYWTELPEFGFLQQQRKVLGGDSAAGSGAGAGAAASLLDRIARLDRGGESGGSAGAAVEAMVTDAFLGFLGTLLGFKAEAFDLACPLSVYGLDSLSGVSCQYWFHKELKVNVAVPEIFAASSIEVLLCDIKDRLGQARDGGR